MGEKMGTIVLATQPTNRKGSHATLALQDQAKAGGWSRFPSRQMNVCPPTINTKS